MPDAWEDLADDIRRARDAVRDRLAERVAELEKAVTNALDFLRQDYPYAAAACLETALARPAEEPDHA